MGQIKVDLHFHPNFSSMRSSRDAAIEILEKCIKYNLTALVISDHAYKDPAGSFRYLYKMQQSLIANGEERYQQLKKVFLFPGLEYLDMEGGEMLLFHDHVESDGFTIIYGVAEQRHPNLFKPFTLTVMDVIDIAKQYHFAIYAPHPKVLGSTGGVKAYGKAIHQFRTRKFQHRVTQLVNNRHLGMSIHNGAFDSISDILRIVKIKVPLFEAITSTPKEILDEADPVFYGGGADAHTPGSMGSGLLITFDEELTRENVYDAIIHNKENNIFRPKRGFMGHISHIKAALKQAGYTVDEIITEKNIEKQLEIEKIRLIEAYTRAWDAWGKKEILMSDIIKIKGLFPGRNLMTELSDEQKQRIKDSIKKRDGKFVAFGEEKELHERKML